MALTLGLYAPKIVSAVVAVDNSPIHDVPPAGRLPKIPSRSGMCRASEGQNTCRGRTDTCRIRRGLSSVTSPFPS